MSPSIKQLIVSCNAPFKVDKNNVEKAREKLLSDTSVINSLLPKEQDLQQLYDIKEKMQSAFKSLIIIGTGASSNIPRAIFSLKPTNTPEIHFLENIDQLTVNMILHKLSPKSTCILTISKSGQTTETIAILLKVIEWFDQALGITNCAQNFYFITRPTPSILYNIAKAINASIIPHPKTSGRYSFFSPVGLLPAAIAGLDIVQMVKSSKDAFYSLLKPDSWLITGTIYAHTMTKLYNNYVFMSYGDKFHGISLWFRQLLAESLGKNSNGVNPMMFTGTVDQHSQLQLYLEGPNDKFFTVLIDASNHPQDRISLPSSIDKIDVGQVLGKTLDEILISQADVVINLLKKHNKNIRVLTMSALNEATIAELCMGLMLETILLGYADNINPFNQPAIERMKNLHKDTRS